jgi:hypothetical protein
MPYYKRNEDCINKSGKKGKFVTIKKSDGKRQCWKSEDAFKRARKSMSSSSTYSEVDENLRDEKEIKENTKIVSFTRAQLRQLLLELERLY